MSGTFTNRSCGLGVTVQDMGRQGFLAQGMARGGAVDVLALREGAALLGHSMELAALEMIGMGGSFPTNMGVRIALTGPITAGVNDTPLTGNASPLLQAGALLKIGGARQGTCGYLPLGGGIDTPMRKGAHATHLSTGLARETERSDRHGP